MRKAYSLLLTFIFAAVAVSCSSDDPKPTKDNVTVITTSVTNVTYNTASSGGVVDGKNVISRGVCWSTSPSPTISDSKTTDGEGEGTFTSGLTGLQTGTKYYVRAYATTKKNTYYGDQVDFNTLNQGTPIFAVQSAVKNADNTSATITVEITSDGSGNITERGVVYATTQEPTVNNNKVTDQGTGTGTYVLQISPLAEGTTYYVRGYAVVSGNTFYTEEVTVRTPGENSLPLVTANDIQTYLGWSCTLTGNVSSLGDMDDAVLSEKGIYYGTDPDPIKNGEKLVVTTGSTGISAKLRLPQGKQIYYAFYGVTQYGEGISDVKSFEHRCILDRYKPWPMGVEDEELANCMNWEPANTGTPTTWSAFQQSIIDAFNKATEGIDGPSGDLSYMYFVRMQGTDGSPILRFFHRPATSGNPNFFVRLEVIEGNRVRLYDQRPISDMMLTYYEYAKASNDPVVQTLVDYVENYAVDRIFVIDWLNDENENQMMIYPEDEPEKNLCGRTFRNSHEDWRNPYAQWW